jgi:hypothetical protein
VGEEIGAVRRLGVIMGSTGQGSWRDGGLKSFVLLRRRLADYERGGFRGCAWIVCFLNLHVALAMALS